MADVPEFIGKYKIVSLVARGGMGAVYKAVHPTLKRYVILKKLTIRGNAVITERFKREARILLDFNDPHIVHLFDYFKEGQAHYIVLEYVDGVSLDVLLKKRGSLSGTFALFILRDVCKALKYAHDNGVIHRDIKPGNILISKTGDIKLADFGIASTENSEADDGLTREGTTLGTVAYMPPEQFSSTKTVDKRADIYAVGVMLYEMVTGVKPFPGSFSPETILTIQKGRFTRAKKLNPLLPHVVSRIISKTIKSNPNKRFKDLSGVIRIIERFLKRYNQKVLEQCLVDSMTAPDFTEPTFTPKARALRIATAVIAASCLCAAGLGLAWQNGLIHRYLLSDSWGALKVSVDFPLDSKEAGDVLCKARVYRADEKDLPEIDESPLVLYNTGDGKKLRFESRYLYLKEGSYRLKVLAEQRVYWYSLRIEALSKKEKAKPTETIIRVAYDRLTPKPMSIRYQAVDAISAKDITPASRFSVLEKGSWVPLDTIKPEMLQTGTIRKFRIEADGYYEEIYSLKIAHSQDELFINARLVPLSGTLSIKSNSSRVRITVNGSTDVILGGMEMKRESLASWRGEAASWKLPSGQYTIKVYSSKGEGTLAVSVEAGKTVRIVATEKKGAIILQKE